MSVCKYKFLIFLIILFLYLIYLCKNREGFNDDFTNYSKTIPNSFIYNSARTKYNDIFSFFKGKGTYKREKIKDTVSDEKISTLNKLLDKLLNRITSDSQNCVGDFDKYSECDKLCGSGGFQTRKYVITQEKGVNGKECPYEDGYEEKESCFIKDCAVGQDCERNRDCISRNCDPKDKKCGPKVECTKETIHVCDEDECRRLNEDYSNASHVLEGKYLYNKRDKKCFFKTPAEMEKLNVNLYTYNYENPDDYTYAADKCAYYQKPGEGGKCENLDKINLVRGKPKCELGWKPEPTYLNGSNACKKCSVLTGLDPDGACVCGGNMEFDQDGVCRPGKANTTKICKLDHPTASIMIVPNSKDASHCQYCEYNEFFKKSGTTTGRQVASCYECPKGLITGRASGSLVVDTAAYMEKVNAHGGSEVCDVDMCGMHGGDYSPNGSPWSVLSELVESNNLANPKTGSLTWTSMTTNPICEKNNAQPKTCGLNKVCSTESDQCCKDGFEPWPRPPPGVAPDCINSECVSSCNTKLTGDWLGRGFGTWGAYYACDDDEVLKFAGLSCDDNGILSGNTPSSPPGTPPNDMKYEETLLKPEGITTPLEHGDLCSSPVVCTTLKDKDGTCITNRDFNTYKRALEGIYCPTDFTDCKVYSSNDGTTAGCTQEYPNIWPFAISGQNLDITWAEGWVGITKPSTLRYFGSNVRGSVCLDKECKDWFPSVEPKISKDWKSGNIYTPPAPNVDMNFTMCSKVFNPDSAAEFSMGRHDHGLNS